MSHCPCPCTTESSHPKSITASTPPTPTVHTLYTRHLRTTSSTTSPATTLHQRPTLSSLPILLLLRLRLRPLHQPRLRHPTHTRPTEIRLLRLHTPQTTQLLVPLLLPLRDQRPVRVLVLQQPLVELLGDGFARVVQVVDVAGPGVGYLENGPERFVFFEAGGGEVLGVAHFVGVLEEGVFDGGEAGGWGFAGAG